MKKIFLVVAIIASSMTFISCSADSISDDPSMTLSADDTGGDGTVPPVKPPDPKPDPKPGL